MVLARNEPHEDFINMTLPLLRQPKDGPPSSVPLLNV
jgi:hypothetical protein